MLWNGSLRPRGAVLSAHPAGALVYGTLRDERGRVLDKCLATYSKAPRSYTGEDTAAAFNATAPPRC